MKLSKVAKLCKAQLNITICIMPRGEGKAVQWVGTPMALYPFHNLPILDEQTAYVLFDVDEKKKDDISYIELEADESPMNLEEYDETDKPIKPHSINIVYGSSVFIPFDTTKGVRLVNRAYITPMESKLDLLAFSERQTEDGYIYIVARLGLLIAGVIAPFSQAGGDKSLVDFSRFFAERMDFAEKTAAADKQAREERQIQLVDRATGELIEDADDEPDAGYRTEFHGVSQEGQASLEITLTDGADEPDEDDETNQAAVIPFGTQPPGQPDKIQLKLRTDNDGGDAA